MFTYLTLTNWYKEHGRDLPWRYKPDDYTVWLSEIILQQTRVKQGLNYIIKFKENYPTVHDLAHAPLDEVLKLWQGLGYYTRARNLHTTAKVISEHYNGIFPDTFDELRKLKGIGDYTAAAIASIVYKLPVAVVDGNVHRVLSRIFGIFTPIDTSTGKKEFAKLAQEVMDKENPGTYNQAIMDFGALVCTPKKAQCDSCPFNNSCYAYLNNCVYELPVKSKKIKVRPRYFNYLVIRYKNFTFIHQRSAKDIWNSLYEFPLIEKEEEIKPEDIVKTLEWLAIFGNEEVTVQKISNIIKHQLSHQTIWCRFYNIVINKPTAKLLADYQKIAIKDFEKFSIPRLIDAYMVSPDNEKFFKHSSSSNENNSYF